MKQDLKWYPYEIAIRRELRNHGCIRLFQFCRWFLNEFRKRQFLANIIARNKARLLSNGQVSRRNVFQYVPVGEPPNFYYHRPDSHQELTL